MRGSQVNVRALKLVWNFDTNSVPYAHRGEPGNEANIYGCELA